MVKIQQIILDLCAEKIKDQFKEQIKMKNLPQTPNLWDTSEENGAL